MAGLGLRSSALCSCSSLLRANVAHVGTDYKSVRYGQDACCTGRSAKPFRRCIAHSQCAILESVRCRFNVNSKRRPEVVCVPEVPEDKDIKTQPAVRVHNSSGERSGTAAVVILPFRYERPRLMLRFFHMNSSSCGSKNSSSSSSRSRSSRRNNATACFSLSSSWQMVPPIFRSMTPPPLQARALTDHTHAAARLSN